MRLSSITCSSDGKWVAAATKELVRIWDARSGAFVRERRFAGLNIDDLVFLTSRDIVRLAIHGESKTFLWSLQSPGFISLDWGDPGYIQEAREKSRTMSGMPEQNDVVLAKLSSDRQTVVVGTVYGGRFVRDRNGRTKAVLQMFTPASIYDVERVDLSQDGEKVAWEDRGVWIIDARSGNLIKKLAVDGTALAISPNGEQVAVGLSDGGGEIAGNTPEERRKSIEQGLNTRRKIVVFEISTGKPVRELTGHDGQINALRFSPDGRRLFSASLDKTVRVWDLTSDNDPIELKHPQGVWSLAFTCGTLITSDGTVREWNVDNRSVVREFGLGLFPTLSKDCSRLAAAQDSHVIVWNRKSGTQLARYSPHDEKRVTFVEFLDENSLMSLGGDGILKVYPAAKNAWYAYTERLLHAYAGKGTGNTTDRGIR